MEDPTPEQAAVPKEGWDSEGSPCWSSLLLGGLQPMEGTYDGAVHEDLQPCGKDSHWRRSWKTVSHDKDPTLEQGKSVRSPPPEEEGAAETTGDELTTTPIPHPPVPL